MRWWIALAFGLLLTVVSCDRSSDPAPADPLGEVFRRQAEEEGLSRSQTEGKRLFGHYCSTCHGDGGHGDGQNAYSLDPKPPDFEESLGEQPPSRWREIIEGGTASVGRSPLCPPWGRTLSVESIDDLVSYLELLGGTDSAHAQEESPETPAVKD